MAACIVCAVLPLLTASSSSADTVRKSMGDGLTAAWTDQHRLFVEAQPREGEGLYAFTRRFTGSTRYANRVADANGNPRRLLRTKRYSVPYEMLSDEYKLRVIRTLFEADEPTANGWRHSVPRSTRGATLWRICEWFTGRGETFKEVARHNGLGDYDIHPGQSVVIPTRLLLAPFAEAVAEVGRVQSRVASSTPPPSTQEKAPQAVPAEPAPTGTASGDTSDTVPEETEEPDPPVLEAPVPAVPPQREPLQREPSTVAFAADGDLRYERDEDENVFAVYHLKQGEALYTAVVVRFTGRVTADAVNELAAELAQLNRIRDVTDMPVGQKVRIPLDVLMPEYLPPADPRRKEWEANRAEAAKYSNPVRATRLEGIRIVLDAGHGGEDPGVDHRGTWESVYVYDVMVRVKKILQERTAAEVHATTRDAAGFVAPERDVLPRSKGHTVLTSPPYAIQDHVVSTHLRWYLANSLYRDALRSQREPSETLFVSLHADSLHPSLRGAMVYVPSTFLTKGEYGKSGSVYLARKEVKEKPRVSYSWTERTRSEGLSRQLADKILGSFRRHGLRVHPEKPVRDRIIRSRYSRPFVPAVVRYNAIPTKLLLEICNMNNPQDRELLQTRAFRQKIAEAIVDGILDYYGQEPLVPGTNVAAAR